MEKLSFKYFNFKLRSQLKNEVPRWFVFLIDLYITVNTFLLTFILLKVLEIGPQTRLYKVVIYQVPIVLVCALTAFLATSSYKGIIRHTGFRDIINVLVTNIVYLGLLSVFYWLILSFSTEPNFVISKSVILVHFLMNVLLMIFLRIFYKGIYEAYVQGGGDAKKVLIYGAGESGVITYKVINKEETSQISVVGFIDDNPKKKKKKIDGVRIYAPNEITSGFIEKNKISEIIISIQKIKPSRLNDIVSQFSETSVQLKIVPAVSKWLNGDLTSRQIKSLNIDDFLGRDPIKLDNEKVREEMNGKVVLVTGAAGSIGSEISRQLMGCPVKKLIMLDQAETAMFDLQQSVKDHENIEKMVFTIADVRDICKMENIFSVFKPELVFHAAAYKHVPLMENNPYEAVITNVKGTKTVADLALKFNSEKFVMVSTDKAVNPTSVMGATKRIAELYVTKLNSHQRTKFIVTRFGNVLGSNGSVIPVFKKQIEKGGPLTVTSKEITRFFMTIPEACELVLEAGAMGEGGEVFVFDMGEPVKIFDLAKKVIWLSGLRYPEDIQIEITGLRPGEKMFEELLNNDENLIDTHHPKIRIAKVERSVEDFENKIDDLIGLNPFEETSESALIISKIKEIVPEYQPDPLFFSK